MSIRKDMSIPRHTEVSTDISTSNNMNNIVKDIRKKGINVDRGHKQANVLNSVAKKHKININK